MKKLLVCALIALGFAIQANANEQHYLTPETCEKIESEISDIIKQSDYCETSSDCVDSHVWCPFGCQVPVNNERLLNVQKLANGFSAVCQTCKFDCDLPKEILCENNKCIIGDKYKK